MYLVKKTIKTLAASHTELTKKALLIFGVMFVNNCVMCTMCTMCCVHRLCYVNNCVTCTHNNCVVLTEIILTALFIKDYLSV